MITQTKKPYSEPELLEISLTQQRVICNSFNTETLIEDPEVYTWW